MHPTPLAGPFALSSCARAPYTLGGILRPPCVSRAASLPLPYTLSGNSSPSRAAPLAPYTLSATVQRPCVARAAPLHLTPYEQVSCNSAPVPCTLEDRRELSKHLVNPRSALTPDPPRRCRPKLSRPPLSQRPRYDPCSPPLSRLLPFSSLPTLTLLSPNLCPSPLSLPPPLPLPRQSLTPQPLPHALPPTQCHLHPSSVE